MKQFTQLLAAVGSVALVASAQSTDQTRTYSNCYTEQGSTKVSSVPTSNNYVTNTVTFFMTDTVTPTTTTTPSITSTSTTTTVRTTTFTAPKTTETTTLTVLSTTTTTSRAPAATVTQVKSTSTIVTTVDPKSTSTVPTPAGFTPVARTVPQSAKRNYLGLAALAARAKHHKTNRRLGHLSKAAAAKTYPQRVVCNNIVEVVEPSVVTRTASNTVTRTASNTVTVVTASTTTSTQTVTAINPPATSTITSTTTQTFTATTTPTSTVTSTTTATLTMGLPAATKYAACGATNLKGQFRDEGIANVVLNDQTLPTANTNDNSAYDCCVTCINTPFCAASAFGASLEAGKRCQNFISRGQCTDGDYSYGLHLDPALEKKEGYIVSNGNCAFYNYFD